MTRPQEMAGAAGRGQIAPPAPLGVEEERDGGRGAVFRPDPFREEPGKRRFEGGTPSRPGHGSKAAVVERRSGPADGGPRERPFGERPETPPSGDRRRRILPPPPRCSARGRAGGPRHRSRGSPRPASRPRDLWRRARRPGRAKSRCRERLCSRRRRGPSPRARSPGAARPRGRRIAGAGRAAPPAADNPASTAMPTPGNSSRRFPTSSRARAKRRSAAPGSGSGDSGRRGIRVGAAVEFGWPLQ